MTQNLINTYQPLPTPVPAPRPTAPVAPAAPDPDLIHTDPAEWQRQNTLYNARLNQQMLSQLAEPMIASQAQLARHASQSGPFADIWRRWGPEIEAELRFVPLYGQTKEVCDKAAEIVKGRHAEEIAEERLQAKMASGVLTERSGGSNGLPSAARDPIDEIWEEDHPYIRMQKSVGLGPKDLRKYAEVRKIPVAKFVEQIRSGNIIFDAARGTTTSA